MSRIFIGFDANGEKLYLDSKDRARHMHVIGSSGSGKSKFLEQMIREDIKKGNGLCLIDPHGTLYEDVLKWLAYLNIKDREIILLNPSQGDYVTGFNPFTRTDGDISVRVDYQITATIRAWGLENTDETPRLERWLRSIYQTLNEREETITASEYLIDFYEPEVRAYLTEQISQRMIRSDWQAISAARTPRQFDEQLESTRNKLQRFLCSPQVSRFMGLRENNINVREIMDEGKILLVNLAESENFSSYNARLFGALLVNELFQEAKRRKPDMWSDTPRPFYLYIDEFQEFVTPDVARILDQTRKFGLHMILSHQRLGQIEIEYPDVFDAVLTNVKTRAVFGGLPRKAAQLMVGEMFVGQIDLKQVKKAIYQTKFWPKYSRDKVYTSTSGYTDGHSTSKGMTSGVSTGTSYDSEGWFAGSVQTDNRAETSGSGSSYSNSSSTSVADVPIFIPVPFRELGSEEYWTLDEQIWKMSDALKAQFPRHCFIQIPGQETQPMLVPFVREFRLYPQDVESYKRALHGRVNALPVEDVDVLLSAEREQLKARAMEYLTLPPGEPEALEAAQLVDPDLDDDLE